MTDYQSPYGAPQFDSDFGQHAQPAPDDGKKRGRKTRKPKGVEKPRSGARTIFIIAAIVAMVAVALYWVGAEDPTAGGTYVVQVKRNIAAYTEITEADLQAVSVNEKLLMTDDDEAFSGLFVAADEESAIEAVFARAEGADDELGETGVRVSRREIAAGTLLHVDDITLASQLSDYVEVEPHERLISIEALPVTAAGGKLQPGDRVDVVLASSSLEVARTFAVDIPVVDVNLASMALESIYNTQLDELDASTADLLPGDPLPGIYTLVVDAQDAPALAIAAESATVYLVARPDDAVDAELPLPEGDDVELTAEPQLDLAIVSLVETFCPGDVKAILGTVPTDDMLMPLELPRKCVAELARIESSIASADIGMGIEGEEIIDDSGQDFTTLDP